MKSNPRLSKSVFVSGIVTLLIFLVLGWYGWKRQQKQSPQAETNIEADAKIQSTTTSLDENAMASASVEFSHGLPPVIPISLEPFLVKAENDPWSKDQQYLLVPRGTQDLGGIEFNLTGMLQLQGQLSLEKRQRKYRTKIEIPLAQTNSFTGEIQERGSNIASLYLLAGTRYPGWPETTIASLVWHYPDGSTRSTPIQFEVHVRDWVRPPFEQPDHLPYAHSKVVWTAPDPKVQGHHLRVYRVGLPNPAPGKLVKQLDLISPMAPPTLFVVGLTLDPVALGMRPDATPDLEREDSIPVNELRLSVRTPNDQPVAKAQIRVLVLQTSATDNAYAYRTLQTDDQGEIVLKYPTKNLERFEVSASHDDYGGAKMGWAVSSGNQLPPSYVLKLTEGVELSGMVVDESDQPISGARLNFFSTWSDAKGAQADFQERGVTTDGFGSWRLRGVSSALVNRIGFKSSHPDFVETNVWVEHSAGEEAKLRDGSHKLVMRRGLHVNGRVLDESGQPVKDAQVWAGRVNYMGTQNVKTDDQGTFSFKNMPPGSMPLSVLAKNYRPVVSNITVVASLPEIVFRLSTGQTVRGMVKNEIGEAVAGVRVALEDPQGGVARDISFEMTTDEAGRFEWRGAPDEVRRFCFLKNGYEAKRRQSLKINEENIITLRLGRKIQGWVVDEESEKPITKFSIGVGQSSTADHFYADHPGMKAFSDPNGMFTMELNEEQTAGIKAEADDYAYKVEKLPEAEGGIVKVVLRLKPSAAVRGVLVNAAGEPVAGATVALTQNSVRPGSAQLRKGRLQTNERIGAVTTDANGNFTLRSPPDAGGIVVAATEAGFASAPVEHVRSSGRLVLEAFGRIEGTIKIAGSPAAGQEVMFTLNNLGISTDWNSYRTASDEQGRFSLDKIPAGEGAVVRLIKMNGNSWRHSHETSVLVQPGKITQVNLGEDGAVIRGQIRFEGTPPEGEAFVFEGSLNTQMPPLTQKFATAEEAQAFYNSPEGKAYTKQMKSYGVSINADGTLSMDSIPPGEYTLRITANKAGQNTWQHSPVASGSVSVTVPAGASPYAPIGINDVILKPVQKGRQ